MTPARVLSVLLPALVLLSCEGEPSRLEWVYRPGEGLDVAAVASVEARVFRGGCAARDMVYRQVYRAGETPPPPEPLDPGPYGISVAVFDEGCFVLGSSCEEVTLPRSTTVVLVVEPEEPFFRCAEDEGCELGLCTAPGADAGTGTGWDAGPGTCALTADGDTSCLRDGRDGLCWIGVCCAECWDAAGCRGGGETSTQCGEGGEMCWSCPAGTFCSGARCLCAPNYRVSGGGCVACDTGTRSAGGDDPAGGNTRCVCDVNWHASGGRCVACPSGSTSAGGEDPATGDTSCTSVICGIDQRVSMNMCVACGANETNEAGDRAAESDTSCDPCGDGVVSGRETCDDRNTLLCGRCNSTCMGAGVGRCPPGTGCSDPLDCTSGMCDTATNTCL